jgi:hypothetical protein
MLRTASWCVDVEGLHESVQLKAANVRLEA